MNKFTRLTALLLALMMIFSTFAAAEGYPVDGMTQDVWSQIVQNAKDKLFTTEEGGTPVELPTPDVPESKPYQNTHEIALNPNEADEFRMSPVDNAVLTSTVAAQWQIALPGGAWANLAGQTGATLEVSYTMLQNVLTDNTAELRQVEYDEEFNVTVVESVKIAIEEAQAVMKLAAYARDGETTGDTSANDNILTLEEANEGQMIIIEVRYQISATQSAATSYVARIGYGSKLNTTLNLPRAVGYLATSYTVTNTAGNPSDAELVAAFTAQTADANGSLKLAVTSEQSTQSYIITVHYEPTDVSYTVKHYLQNVNDDGYTLDATETKSGLTGTQVGATLYKTYPGFTGLWYDGTAEIAADGKTEISIYYDREYYLMGFVLGEKGYGVDPIYARYDAPISVGEPKRPGYEFLGWSETPVAEQTDPKVLPTFTEVEVPPTMPLGGDTLYAVWDMNDTSTVSIVIWGENADDEGYSYNRTIEVKDVESGSQYIYGGANLTCTEVQHKHDADCGTDCGDEEHTHTDACYEVICGQTEHATHTAACYGNCEYADHTHDIHCYAVSTGTLSTTAENDSTRLNSLNNATAAANGVYMIRPYSTRYYYIKVGNSYYRITGSSISQYNYDDITVSLNNCSASNHTHNDACFSCHLHVGECYKLICGKDEHTHVDACYTCGITVHAHNADCFTNDPAFPVASDNYLWEFAGMDVVEVKPDGSTVVNVYYDRTTFTLHFKETSTSTTDVKTITEKWGADIHSEFPIENSSGETILWSVPYSCESFEGGTYLASINRMPAENITFTNYDEVDAATIYYCIEVLPGEGYTYDNTYNGTTKYFKLYKQVRYTKSGYLTYAEEFHDILGFKQWDSDPEFSSFDKDGKTSRINDNNYLFYTRNVFNIVYYDPTNLVKTIPDVPYEASLNSTTYNWVPTPPSTAEPGSVVFAGWYLNPEGTGEPFDFTTATMPAGPNNTNGEVALSLYAKWVPATHTVNYYLTEDDMTAGTNLLDTESVTHGQYAPAVEEPENGGYTFAGWYYIDEDGNEMRFDHNSMTIRRDMDIYAKWTATDPVTFTFYYKDEAGNEIASPLHGQALPGQTVTKNAKVDDELDKLPEDVDPLSYIPNVSSHSIEINIDATQNEYTFVYKTGIEVEYTIQYLEATIDENGVWTPVTDADGNYNHLLPEEKQKTTKAVETENYKPILGYMPQTTQIRLVLSADDPTKNVIQFLYVENNTDALYNITHYLVDHEGNVSFHSGEENIPGTIDSLVTAEWHTDIDGYEYNAELTKVEVTYQENGEWVTDTVDPEVPTVEGEENTVGHTLPAGGLHFKLYYTPKNYPYIVYHVDEDGNQLADPDTGVAPYGSTVIPTAKDITNYVVESIVPGSVVIEIETIKLNEIDVAAGKVPENNVMTITYRLDVSTLQITKVVEDAADRAAPTDDKFTIQVTFGFASGAAVPSKYTLNGGTAQDISWNEAKTVATFPNIQDGDVIVIQDVVIGTTYTVAETDGVEHYAWEVKYPGSGDTHAVAASGNEVEVENTYLTGTLTINKTVSGRPDNESFIFKVTGPSFDGYVTIKNGGSVMLSNLVLGTYTVTETNWSYRYTPDSTAPKSADLSKADPDGEVTFNNTEKDEKWLHDESYIHNDFSKNTGTN